MSALWEGMINRASDACRSWDLDTPRHITDTSGNVVWQWDSADPFGNNPPNENPSGQGAFNFNLRFPGQYFDKETGLHQNYFREYNPAIGGYLQGDPLGLDGGSASLSTNVLSNPLNYTDPLDLNVTITIDQDTYTDDSVTGTINVSSDNKKCGCQSFSRNTSETASAGPEGDKDPILPDIYNAFVRKSHGGKRIELEDVDG